MNEAPDYPEQACAVYEARRNALIEGLHRIGWHVEPPKGTMFTWAPIPTEYGHMDSVEFASMLVKNANVALSPGVGFGPGGEGNVRFALIENEQRIGQGISKGIEQVAAHPMGRAERVHAFVVPAQQALAGAAGEVGHVQLDGMALADPIQTANALL